MQHVHVDYIQGYRKLKMNILVYLFVTITALQFRTFTAGLVFRFIRAVVVLLFCSPIFVTSSSFMRELTIHFFMKICKA